MSETIAKRTAPSFRQTAPKVVTPAEPSPEPPPIVLKAVNCDLLEPFELIWFRNGRPVTVAQRTRWMDMQIAHGLLQVV